MAADVEQLANEAFTIARALFAVSPDLAERGAELRARLAEIERSLRAASGPPRTVVLAEAVARILEACDAAFSRAVFGQLKRQAMSALLAGGPSVARTFLDEMIPWIRAMRGRPVADGFLTGRLLIVRELTLAMAAAAGPGDAAVFGGNLGAVAAPGPAPLDAVVDGLCARALCEGHSAAVRSVAEDLKARGDQRIRDALGAGLDAFYPALFEAASYEVAAGIIGRVGARADPDRSAEGAWRGLADDAEERTVRIAGSLDNAVANLDGRAGDRHRQRVRELRRTAGEQAALDEAHDLVLRRLLYPRAALPILLG